MMTEMRLDDPRPDLMWKLKVALQRYAYAAVDAMCVSARKEATICAERVRVPLDRFRFVPWHTNVLEPRLCAPVGEYVFAAGRTGRDWRTLAEAARGVAATFIIVCSRSDIETISFPSNVTTLTDIPYQRYRELLEGARIVVVPLEPHTYSTGQVVILEAMALGKPVVAARVLGTEDYIADGVDGILVTPGNAVELGAAISKILSVPGLADGIGRSALNRIERAHTLDQYVHNVIGIAGDLAAGRRPRLSVGA
jgi:glycosyltransferase involved in cell wall biosynthesis